MSGNGTPEDPEIPENWDRLVEVDEIEEDAAGRTPAEPGAADDRPSWGVLLSASWADLAVILTPCAAALAALRLAGYPTNLAVVPWAAALGLAWWTVTAAVLLRVRRGTPGMLLVDLRFDDPVAHGRVGLTLLASLGTLLLAGLPGILGRRYWPLSLAARSIPSVSPHDP